MEKPSFLKNHADTVAIIGVNLGIAAILVAILLSNISSISAVNARTDLLMQMIHTETTNFHNEMKEFHGRLCSIEERGKN